MDQAAMLYPMLALMGWTMTVLALVGARRAMSRLHLREFALGESPAVPAQVTLANRNFMNLLEVPVLFYVVSITYYVTEQGSALAVGLAWAFVVARVAHTAVHVTYNHVLHRFGFFVLSNLVLMGLWVNLLVRIA